jgi:hypothetical protein
MNESDAERFGRISRSIQYGATIKDLAWLVRLVEKLDRENGRDRGGSLKKEVAKKVDFFFVEVSDATAPTGKKFGVQCDACGEQFFDRLSGGKNPRLLGSGIPLAIAHAKEVHASTGGVVGRRKSAVAR